MHTAAPRDFAVPAASNEARVSLPNGPYPPKALPGRVVAHKLAPGELSLERIHELDPESLIDYCEKRHAATPGEQKLGWRHALGVGSVALFAVSLLAYHVYQADARSAAHAVSALAPPPLPGFNASDLL